MIILTKYGKFISIVIFHKNFVKKSIKMNIFRLFVGHLSRFFVNNYKTLSNSNKIVTKFQSLCYNILRKLNMLICANIHDIFRSSLSAASF